MTISKSANDTTIGPDNLITWILDIEYTTYGPSYPQAKIYIEDNIPSDFSYVQGSDFTDFQGEYLGVVEDDEEILFKFDITPSTPPTFEPDPGNESIYQRSITYQTRSSDDISAGSYQNTATVYCFDMDDISNPSGSETCTTSTSYDNAIENDSDSVTVQVDDGCDPTGDESDMCEDGKDNDCDGDIDCTDSECVDSSVCDDDDDAPTPTNCGNSTIESDE